MTTEPWKTEIRREIPEGTYSISLTGHRPAALDGYDLSTPFYRKLEAGLHRIAERALERYGAVQLHSGMALGADTVWSKAALRLRDEHPEEVYFVAEVPVLTQPDRWVGTKDKALWQEHVDTADVLRVYGESYSVGFLHARNQGMIEAANLLLAVWNGSTSGGTAGAVRYAEKIGRKTHRIDPDGLKVKL